MIRVKRGHIDAFDSNPQIGLGFNLHAKNFEGFDAPLSFSPVKKPKTEKEDKPRSVKTKSNFPRRKIDIKGMFPLNYDDIVYAHVLLDMEVQKWISHLPRPRRKYHQLVGSLYSSSYTDSVFSLEDVKNIVCGVLNEKQEELRKEYDSVLLDRLSEQWETLTRYNEDCIKKQMCDSTYSYYS